MTNSVLPPFSSKVTVVTGPSSLSSLVQTRRECGVTMMYLPKNAIGFEASWPNSNRYLPPTRTSASQESKDTPVDFGAHHRLSSSGLGYFDSHDLPTLRKRVNRLIQPPQRQRIHPPLQQLARDLDRCRLPPVRLALRIDPGELRKMLGQALQPNAPRLGIP